MASNYQIVFLVVDASWRGDLHLMSQAGHVWIIDSALTSPQVAAVRNELGANNAQNRGVTTFNAASPIQAIGECVGLIDEHHSGDPKSGIGQWNVIEVIGVRWEEALKEMISAQLPGTCYQIVATDAGMRIVRN